MEKTKISSYDPNTAISADYGIFGLPITEADADIVLVPVPWEVTTSYGSGASWGPQLIRKASEQIDLFDFETGKAYEVGYFMKEFPVSLKKMNDENKLKAQELIGLVTAGSQNESRMVELRKDVNLACEKMIDWVYQNSQEIIKADKGLGLVGGDHSTPLGALRAISESCQGEFGVLHIDAHADLRSAYQGFTHSHASIMYNVMNAPWKPAKLVQVGIRDFCEEEFELIDQREDIRTFFDLELKAKLFEGALWKDLCEDIVSELPQNVYVSFDIDGLDPSFCPHTGTPVPGGLQMDQIFYLFQHLYKSGRNLIGFDVNEVSSGGVAPEQADPWDGNVGARVLYKLCGWLALSRQRMRDNS
jgi:agmatinase